MSLKNVWEALYPIPNPAGLTILERMLFNIAMVVFALSVVTIAMTLFIGLILVVVWFFKLFLPQILATIVGFIVALFLTYSIIEAIINGK